MNAHLIEWLNLVIRWIHLITGIGWIGSSFFFMWLDSHLSAPRQPRERLEGELWMVHSGGFYEVQKKLIAPEEMPDTLHWFKWEAAFTWISGFFLLGIVYYMGGGSYLIDPSIAKITPLMGMGIGIGLLIAGWAVYDVMWNSPLAKYPKFLALLSFFMVGGVAYGLSHVFSGRGAFIHVGAMLGTMMVGNVWMRIIPSQRNMVKATEAGQIPDYTLGERAKMRSVHNNYMTFPVLFLMLSNHFASTYEHSHRWLVLMGLISAGVGVKHFMNVKNTLSRIGLALSIGLILVLFYATSPSARQPSQAAVPFAQVQAVIQQRCTTCHSAKPSDAAFPMAPAGVKFDTPVEIKAMSARIQARAVDTQAMPLGNKTGMTQAERDLLAQWLAAGAKVE